MCTYESSVQKNDNKNLKLKWVLYKILCTSLFNLTAVLTLQVVNLLFGVSDIFHIEIYCTSFMLLCFGVTGLLPRQM